MASRNILFPSAGVQKTIDASRQPIVRLNDYGYGDDMQRQQIGDNYDTHELIDIYIYRH